jgi:hypothetical protein
VDKTVSKLGHDDVVALPTPRMAKANMLQAE